jgi:hypothetical protein
MAEVRRVVRALPEVSERDTIGAGTLNLIVVDVQPRALPRIAAALDAHVRRQDLRAFGAAAWVAFTDADPADIRDWLAPHLRDGESLLVTEFERWSSRGETVDRRWMLRRGH